MKRKSQQFRSHTDRLIEVLTCILYRATLNKLHTAHNGANIFSVFLVTDWSVDEYIRLALGVREFCVKILFYLLTRTAFVLPFNHY